MEPASNVSGLQLSKVHQHIRPSYTPRAGQRRLFEEAVKAHKTELTAVFPTGYGKSVAGLGVYGIMKGRGDVDRCLWLVPTDSLRQQISRDAEKDASDLGFTLVGAVDVTKEGKDLRNHMRDKADVFVATYAQVARDDGFFADLMHTGKWLVVRDECHRLREDRAWGQQTAALGGKRLLNLTATPVRSDGASSVAVPERAAGDGTKTVEADVVISIRDAIEERALRQPIGHVQHYFVDVQSDDGEVVRITTESLRDGVPVDHQTQERVHDLQDYEARRQLRYCRKYLSKMLLSIHQRWLEKNMQPGHENQHQVLVFAMTTDHARALTDQLNDIAGQRFADWIGVSRDKKINDKVLNEYLGYVRKGKSLVPIPDEQRLPCLVQVDMASEGFNNKKASILAFLHLVKSNAKLAQQIGRGLRRNPEIEQFEDDVCDVFASADTEIADYVQRLEVELSNSDSQTSDRPNDDNDDEPRLSDIPDLPVLDAEWQRTDVVTPAFGGGETQRQKRLRELAQQYGIDAPPDQLEKLLSAWVGDTAQPAQPSPQLQSQGSSEAYWREQSNKAIKTLAHNIVKLRCNGSFDKSLLPNTIKACHTRWARESGLKASDMTADEHERKYRWARDINAEVKESQEVPAWAML